MPGAPMRVPELRAAVPKPPVPEARLRLASGHPTPFFLPLSPPLWRVARWSRPRLLRVLERWYPAHAQLKQVPVTLPPMTNDDQPNIPVGQPAPFSAIRRTIINTFKIGKSPKPAEPIIRPEGLDTRLDPALAADLDTLDPNGNEALQLLFKVTDSIEFELEAIDQITRPVDLISEPRRIVIVAYWIENEINNGGLAQYYLNSSGDNAAIAPDLLRKIDLPDLASIIERANAFFPNANPPRDRAERTRHPRRSRRTSRGRLGRTHFRVLPEEHHLPARDHQTHPRKQERLLQTR